MLVKLMLGADFFLFQCKVCNFTPNSLSFAGYHIHITMYYMQVKGY